MKIACVNIWTFAFIIICSLYTDMSSCTFRKSMTIFFHCCHSDEIPKMVKVSKVLTLYTLPKIAEQAERNFVFWSHSSTDIFRRFIKTLLQCYNCSIKKQIGLHTIATHS